MKDFKEKLYEALHYAFERIMDTCNQVAHETALQDIGDEIVEYLQESGYCLDESWLLDDSVDEDDPESGRYHPLGDEYRSRIDALSKEINFLRDLLPLCSRCGKTREEEQYRSHVENYLREHTDEHTTFGLCALCQEAVQGELRDWDCRR
jgi:hypothetical protein